jgi:hypothetical protein
MGGFRGEVGAAVAGVGCSGRIFLFLSFPFSSLPSVSTDIVFILIVRKSTGGDG